MSVSYERKDLDLVSKKYIASRLPETNSFSVDEETKLSASQSRTSKSVNSVFLTIGKFGFYSWGYCLSSSLTKWTGWIRLALRRGFRLCNTFGKVSTTETFWERIEHISLYELCRTKTSIHSLVIYNCIKLTSQYFIIFSIIGIHSISKAETKAC